MTQKSEKKTEVQELSTALAEKLVRKIIINKGQFCLRGDLDNPLAVMAVGPIGPAGRDGRDAVDGIDGKDGIGSPGKDGLRGPRGESIVGPAGPTGRTTFPKMSFDGTKLCIDGLDSVDLRGPSGIMGPVGSAGKNGCDGSNGRIGQTGAKGDCAVMPADIIDILARIERLESK